MEEAAIVLASRFTCSTILCTMSLLECVWKLLYISPLLPPFYELLLVASYHRWLRLCAYSLQHEILVFDTQLAWTIVEFLWNNYLWSNLSIPMVVCATWVPRNHKLALHILLRIGGRKCYFLPLSLILDFSVPLRDSIQIVSIKELETLGEEGDTNREHDRHAPMVNNHLIDFSFPCTYEALTFVIVNEAKKWNGQNLLQYRRSN